MTFFLRFFSAVTLIVLTALPAMGTVIQVGVETLSVPTAAGVTPLPIRVPLSSVGTPMASLTVSSDASWVESSVDAATSELVLTFNSAPSTAGTSTATVRVSGDGASDTFFVELIVSTPNITRLLGDPFRSRVYGLQRDGVKGGALIVFDPIAGSMVGSLALGRNPTGLAISRDGSELFALNVTDKTISVVDLKTLKVSEVLGPLPFAAWDPTVGTAEVAAGAGDILYYTDTSWAPVMRVYNRRSKQVLQAIDIKGNVVTGNTSYNDDSGFGDFVVSPDGSSLFAWAQYGWSAGLASSFLARFSIAPNGILTTSQATTATWPDGLQRDPLDSPIFINATGSLIFAKELAVSAANIATIQRSFPGTIRSISRDGEIATTDSKVFDVVTGNPLYELPKAASVQVITGDYGRLVYFDGQTLQSIDLHAALGDDALPGQKTLPADGSITLAPDHLQWNALLGVGRYRVYFGTSKTAVTTASPTSPEFLGEVSNIAVALAKPTAVGVTYYWRIDGILPDESLRTGSVRSFTVSTISASRSQIETATLQGHAHQRETVALSSQSPGLAWQATADQSWVSFAAANGQTPAPLEAIFDASHLDPGVHRATISVSAGGAKQFELPVTLTVAPLHTTILKSDPFSFRVYGISEDTSSAEGRAYLFEFDARTETIERVVDVGTSVTDLAVHPDDGTIYVPNWMPGLLRAIDTKTFTPIRTYGFKPFGGTGYGEGDVYRVSPAGHGRLVVEEEDQWIDTTLFDTKTGASIATSFLREGGGATTSGGRYYYHGDNNTSNAAIHRFDLGSETFAPLQSKRVESGGYYGSRIVLASEDGAKIFWNGSVFDAALTELWTIGEIIFATSPEGRLAFGETRIFDTTQQKEILGMPVATTVSAFNGTTRKLITQDGARLRCDLIGDPYQMPAPQLAKVEVGPTSATLTWTDHSLETSFTLQYQAAGSSMWTNATAAAINTIQAVISNLVSDQTYNFRIKADSPITSSNWSDILSATTTASPPSAPVLSAPALNNGRVRLQWSASTGADTYLVERKYAEESAWRLLAEVAAPALTYTDTSTNPDSTYNYRIIARSRNTTSTPSNPRTVTVFAPPRAPASIEVLLRADGSAVIVWDAVPAATNYLLQRRLQGTEIWMDVTTLDGQQTSFQDTSGTAQYSYRVATNNAIGTSEFRESSSTPAPPLASPTPAPTPTPPTKPRPQGDVKNPVLHLFGPRVRVTNLSYCIVGGTARDDRKLKRIVYRMPGNSEPVRADGSRVWRILRDLQPGINTFTFWAEDASGNKSRQIRVTVIRN